MEQPERKWTMVIDLDKCTGCAACVVACHAENNVPIVTEDEVARSRGQHWIRIERYWVGEYPHLEARFLPLLCQQCDNAPCEPVCPVYASVHSEREGLNLQVYNRCVGTRYCANNCPYKVRFFNWYDPVFPEPQEQQLNPDVTVRSAGVMEKCTFCVQRSRNGRLPACVEACPTGARVFGNLLDPDSEIRFVLKNKKVFRFKEELGTDPKFWYFVD